MRDCGLACTREGSTNASSVQKYLILVCTVELGARPRRTRAGVHAQCWAGAQCAGPAHRPRPRRASLWSSCGPDTPPEAAAPGHCSPGRLIPSWACFPPSLLSPTFISSTLVLNSVLPSCCTEGAGQREEQAYTAHHPTSGFPPPTGADLHGPSPHLLQVFVRMSPSHGVFPDHLFQTPHLTFPCFLSMSHS